MNLIMSWQSLDARIVLVVFCAYLVIDAMYAYYTLSVIRKRPATSATIGALMHFLMAFGVLNYVQNYLYVVPLALGSWVGTYIVVKYDLKKGI